MPLLGSTSSQTIKAEGYFWSIDIFEGSTHTITPVENKRSYPYTVKCIWYEVNRTDAHTIVVNVNENTTGNERRFTIQLEMGDYFDSISVTQVK